MPEGPSAPPHPPGAAATGAWRIRVLDAALLGRAPEPAPPSPLDQELPRWAGEIIASARGPARGLVDVEVPERWRETLKWAGVPFGTAGDLSWGVHLQEQSDLAVPECRGGRLLLPAPGALAQLTSLALKPLRLFVAAQLGCRLQVAAGVHFYLWANQAALVSCVLVPIGGFLHGPEEGQRHSLSIVPGACQLVTW
jgi:hypothetical protein